MMKQQLVWQDMNQAPKDREILVGIKSECDGPIRFDSVVFNLEEFEEDEDGEESDPGFASAKNTWFSYNDDYYYSNDELVGWIEVPVLTKAILDQYCLKLSKQSKEELL